VPSTGVAVEVSVETTTGVNRSLAATLQIRASRAAASWMGDWGDLSFGTGGL
jgi:hypothetical protein